MARVGNGVGCAISVYLSETTQQRRCDVSRGLFTRQFPVLESFDTGEKL